ncbi:MAG TPA: LLM class F420-dependent oxidoreductase [Gammaproteobacteria bacterium]|nr:LLM class F420-dependent oxidoreductase [Gammaproteobacteria bacterium]|tara:strand:- start:8 stop:877 length:870 start_codon:yes stop_codon:yes gene_type:complete
MKFGLRYCNTGSYVDPANAIELVQAAEVTGFDSVWTVEHTVIPAGYDSSYPYAASGKMAGGVDDIALPDPLIWMAYVASSTTTIKFATGIVILPQHNPVVVAKQVATLDYLTSGRVLFGVGVGWLKEEFEALGVPFERRGERADEYIEAIQTLWTQDKPSYSGEFVNFEEAYCRPQPFQKSIPIIIGGQTKAAARRAGRLADGFFPGRDLPVDLIEEARAAAVGNGREAGAIEITVSMPSDTTLLVDYARFGVSRVLVPVTGLTGLDSGVQNPGDVLKWKDTIARYADT